MINSANNIQIEMKVKGQHLGTITSLKYLGTVDSYDGSKPKGGSLKDCTSHCNSYDTKANLER